MFIAKIRINDSDKGKGVSTSNAYHAICAAQIAWTVQKNISKNSPSEILGKNDLPADLGL